MVFTTYNWITLWKCPEQPFECDTLPAYKPTNYHWTATCIIGSDKRIYWLNEWLILLKAWIYENKLNLVEHFIYLYGSGIDVYE